MKFGTRLRQAARPKPRTPAERCAEGSRHRADLHAARKAIETARKRNTLQKRLDGVISDQERALTAPPQAVEGMLSVRVLGGMECPPEDSLPLYPLEGLTVELYAGEQRQQSTPTDAMGLARLARGDADVLVVRADSGAEVARRALKAGEEALRISLGSTPALAPYLSRGARWNKARRNALVERERLLKLAEHATEVQLRAIDRALKTHT